LQDNFGGFAPKELSEKWWAKDPYTHQARATVEWAMYPPLSGGQ